MALDFPNSMTANEPSGVQVGMVTYGADVRVSQCSESDTGAMDFLRPKQPIEQHADRIGAVSYPGVIVYGDEQQFAESRTMLGDALDRLGPQDQLAAHASLFPIGVDQVASSFSPEVGWSEGGDIRCVHPAVQSEQDEGVQRPLGGAQDRLQFRFGKYPFAVLGDLLALDPSLIGGGRLAERFAVPGLGFDQACGSCRPPEHRADGLHANVQLPRPVASGPSLANLCEIGRAQVADVSMPTDDRQERYDSLVVVVPRLFLDTILPLDSESIGDLPQRWIGGDDRFSQGGESLVASFNQVQQEFAGFVFTGPCEIFTVNSLGDTSVGSLGQPEGELSHDLELAQIVGAESKNSPHPAGFEPATVGLESHNTLESPATVTRTSAENQTSLANATGLIPMKSWRGVGASGGAQC